MYNKITLLFICLLTSISARAQEKIVATAKNGHSLSFYIKEKFGEQASNNFIYAHLINDGPSEDMSVILGYTQYQKQYWFSAEIQGFPELYAKNFGSAVGNFGVNFFRWENNSEMLVRSFEYNPSMYGQSYEYRTKLPTITNINGGLCFRAGYINQLGSSDKIDLPNNYFIDDLYSVEVGIGPQINFFRHLSFSYSGDLGSYSRRSCFFSIRTLVTFNPYYKYSYEKDFLPSPPYNAAFDSSSVPIPLSMVFRTQIDGRFKYLTRLDWGLAWRAGVMTNAFLNERFFYGGIGLFIGWGKQRQYKSLKEY